jgi:hypothetical protein
LKHFYCKFLNTPSVGLHTAACPLKETLIDRGLFKINWLGTQQGLVRFCGVARRHLPSPAALALIRDMFEALHTANSDCRVIM